MQILENSKQEQNIFIEEFSPIDDISGPPPYFKRFVE
jgi:hypothetical protein